jgi:FdhD protein
MSQAPGRQSIRRVTVWRDDDSSAPDRDLVAIEAPLQVVVNGDPFAVIMRTPGDDEALTAGFLFSEGVVSRPADIAGGGQGRTSSGRDEWRVMLAADAAGMSSQPGRRVHVNASCGMCGRVSVESIEIERPPLTPTWQVDAAVVGALPGRLRSAQPVFDQTGGLHASGLFDLEGRLLDAAEDVGRHNALDKVVGRMFLDGRLPLENTLLVVSGRSSYEIVQKAFLAGIPLIAAVSAPSSLAVELADAAGLTLCGFVRGTRFNVYTHPERIRGIKSMNAMTEPADAKEQTSTDDGSRNQRNRRKEDARPWDV